MKDRFNTGLTLIELLVVISLTGLIFTLGIYPIVSQMRLIRAEKSETYLFDDANLAVNYIIKDAMRAEKVNNGQAIGTTGAWVEFKIARDPANRLPQDTVRYQTNGANLERYRNGALDIVISRQFNGNPAFKIISDTTRHRLSATLNFRNPKDTKIATQRTFDVMLRCRDANTNLP
jgi:Tfp pilus assembly protein FimT